MRNAAIPAPLRRLVRRRAAGRCEYCQLSQQGQEATFHVDHIVPVTADGPTSAENLALACVSCSLRKAARQTAKDPDTGHEVRLFNPRQDRWHEHFRWKGVVIVGQTAIGQATIAALDPNRPVIRAIREEEIARGRHPHK
ncbi:MAG: HNH endonuclease [Deltaproteobacteria bacterium]|nr:HNH endonuclease [Deltaproteobacteria bacterium]